MTKYIERLRASVRKNVLTRTQKKMALAYLDKNRPDFARLHLKEICRLDRLDAVSWHALAMVNTQLKLFPEAEACWREVVSLRPNDAEGYNNLGRVLISLEKRDEAQSCFTRAIAANSRYAMPHYNLGNIYQDQGRHQEAIRSYHKARQIDPKFLNALVNEGYSWQCMSKLDEAADCYCLALATRPDFCPALINLGSVRYFERRVTEAIKLYERVIELDPSDSRAHDNLGFGLMFMGKFQEAGACYVRAAKLASRDARPVYNLAAIELLQGKFDAGWIHYAARQRKVFDEEAAQQQMARQKAVLQGKPVILKGEQGLGDQIFFLRFVRHLRKSASRIACQPHPKIATIVARIEGIDEIVPEVTSTATGELALPLGDLPWLLAINRLEQVPPPVMLRALPIRVDAMKKRLAAVGPGPYVGLTWRAGTRQTDYTRHQFLCKEIPGECLGQALSSTPGTLLALQRHPEAAEISNLSQLAHREAHDFSGLNEDLEDMLALLSLLDEYVGVSNTNMHLRAGLGKTARVLIPNPPEWRWMASGDVSPWFPDFKLYRETVDTGWKEAIERLNEDLQHTLGHRR